MANIFTDLGAKLLRAQKQPASLLALAHDFIRIIDKLYKNAPIEVACKKGCGYCCHIPVYVFTHEIIAAHIAYRCKQSKALIHTIEEKIHSSAKHNAGLSLAQRRRINIACPMLINGACTIHRSRPIVCAGANSIDLQPCLYSYHHPDDDSAEQISLEPPLAKSKQLLSQLSAALRQSEQDHNRYELTQALDLLQQEPGLIRKWQKGKPIFANRISHIE